MQSATESYLDRIWYGKHPAGVILAPFGWLFRWVVGLRRFAFRSGLLRVFEADVPVIVVGNLTVGGTGKTPLVIWIAEYLAGQGYRPGIVSRGYGGKAKSWPQQVRADSDPQVVGDEALVIARRAGCPVAVGPDRAGNVRALLAHSECDIVISDDGLQHHRLGRTLEIVVIDGVRRFGNGRCLPAGPLREPLSRIETVDLLVTNGIGGRGEFSMSYRGTHLLPVSGNGRALRIEDFEHKQAHAVAGIGHPERFFTMLRSKGIRCVAHAFPDHKRFQAKDLQFDDDLPIIMTEKDAVKCERFARDNCWYVPIDAELPEVFGHRLMTTLKEAVGG